LANFLLELGVRKGDHISLFMRNRLELPEIYFAISAVGAVALPINYMMEGNNLVQLLNQSDAQYIFVEEEQLSILENINEKLHFISTETTIVVGASLTEKYLDYEKMLSEGSEEDPGISVSPEDVALILYSSGTTSLPKGIVLTQKIMMNRAIRAALDWGLNYSSTVLVSVPMYHSVGQLYTMIFGLTGCKIVISREFLSETTLQLIQEHQINHAFFVPTQYHLLLGEPTFSEYKLSSLNLLVSAAAPLSQARKKAIIENFNCKLTEFFGCTETGLIVTLHSEDVIRKADSLGQQVEYTEVRLVDEKGNDVGVGEEGEFVARGPLVFCGYYQRKIETKEAFLPGGWLRTGDMGQIDSEGFYYLLGRKKDMIISGGVNIYPRDIEEIILTHNDVADAAVVGIPDEVWGEAVKAFVVVKAGQRLTEEEIIHYCNGNLAKFQRLKEVEYISSLPYNPSGKLMKNELRKRQIQV